MMSAPSSAWILQRCSTNCEAENAAEAGGDGVAGVTKHHKAVAEEAGAGDKAKPRRTKLVRVSQEYIDCLLKEPHPKVFDGVPEEIINQIPDPVLRERLRTTQANSRATLQTMVDQDLDILNQFREKGYAVEEVETDDDDEE